MLTYSVNEQWISQFSVANETTWPEFFGLFSFTEVIISDGVNLIFFSGYIATELVDLGLDENNVGFVMGL